VQQMSAGGATGVQQLIYYSRPFGFDRAMLAGILETSRRRNQQNDITGALICRSDIFIQLLEGPVGKVENTFDRILQDDRHVEVTLLVRASIEDRLFGDWAMFHDPQYTPLWTAEDIRLGVPLEASAREVRAIFLAVAEAAGL